MYDDSRKNELRGEVLSTGAAKGTLYLWDFSGKPNLVKGYEHLPPDEEIQRFEKGLDSLIEQVEQSIKSLKEEGYNRQADIIRTHLYLLNDPQFRKDIRKEIKTNKIAAETAVETVLKEMIRTFEQSENPLFMERAGDIRDIISQLKQKLAQQEKHLWDYLYGLGDVVLAIRELTPSFLLEARKQRVVGFIVRTGTALSHTIILAKSFGLPVIRISDFRLLESHNLEQILIDGMTHSIIFEPSEQILGSIKSRTAVEPEETFRELPVNLWVNIINPEQLSSELTGKIKGVGLYRTEALYMEQQDDFPSEQMQVETYVHLFEKCREIPVTFRTADIGGDKMLRYFSLGSQENPYLGFRAHRIFRYHPEIFITQIRAVLRAAVNASELKLMYPMIESTDELFFVQDLTRQAIDSLDNEGLIHKRDFQQGIMIEVPSAAWNCREILEYVDFASLGTNDLFQYFFAVDRNNSNAYRSYQPENHTAIRMLKFLVETSRQLNKPLSICGEIASNKRFLPLLIGMGFEDISIDVHNVDEIRRFMLGLDIEACSKLAEKCLAAGTSREVNKMLNHFMPETDFNRKEAMLESSDLIDPVCGMVVHVDDSYITENQGQKYYFCSMQCKKEFERNLINNST